MKSSPQMQPAGEKGEARQAGLTAFGLSLHFDVAPPGAWVARPAGGPGRAGDTSAPGGASLVGEAGRAGTAGPAGEASLPSLEIRSYVSTQAIEDSWSGLQEIGWEGVIDGAPFVVERGIAGDHRFVHGTHPDGVRAVDHLSPADGVRAVHHLSADASVLQCAPADPVDSSWWRVVLDSVLFTVALLQGYEALHAGAVATPDGVIAITAASGGGKSTLLSELLGRGLALMADDVLVLAGRGGMGEARGGMGEGRGGTHEARGIDFSLSPLSYPAPPLMTVPKTRLSMLGEGNLIISSLEDEHWIAVPVYPEPLPLKTLVVLDRQPGLQLSLKKIEDPLAPLMGSLMNFPRTPERQRTRFELAGTLASQTTLWRLTADVDTPPDVLADTLLAG
jgi:hypothetical protein